MARKPGTDSTPTSHESAVALDTQGKPKKEQPQKDNAPRSKVSTVDDRKLLDSATIDAAPPSGIDAAHDGLSVPLILGDYTKYSGEDQAKAQPYSFPLPVRPTCPIQLGDAATHGIGD